MQLWQKHKGCHILNLRSQQQYIYISFKMLDLKALVLVVFGDIYVPINAIPNHFKCSNKSKEVNRYCLVYKWTDQLTNRQVHRCKSIMSPLLQRRGEGRFKIEVSSIQENKSHICEKYITLTHGTDRPYYRLKALHSQTSHTWKL